MNEFNNLYPPILAPYAPTFTISQTAEEFCKVPFSYSQYNDPEKITGAQVTIVDQRTNATVLKYDDYPSKIKICKIEVNQNTEPFNEKYFITIKGTDLIDGFQINHIYKIQISLIKDISLPTDKAGEITSKGIESWLSQQQEHFSEWSRVILARGIAKPRIELQNFIPDSSSSAGTLTFPSSTIIVAGKVLFENKQETDQLVRYKLSVYSKKSIEDESRELIVSSPLIYASSYSKINEINYTFDRDFKDGLYQLEVYIETQNAYKDNLRYNFNIITKLAPGGPLPVRLAIEQNPEKGVFLIDIFPTSGISYNGKIVFRRASAEDNFTSWEEIHATKIINSPLRYSWEDYSIQSGVQYKYSLQSEDEDGIRNESIISNVQMCVFEDMFIGGDFQQIRIQYNQDVSSFKRIVQDAKIETLGSQYPFIKRNGILNYATFPISGLIAFDSNQEQMTAFLGDPVIRDQLIKRQEYMMIHNFNEDQVKDLQDASVFLSKSQLYKYEQIESFYNTYNKTNNITNYNDIILEKLYRDAVLEFLMRDSVKLFRTATEGNFFVRLLDVSLTPEKVLGRRIYSFTATAYEIDKYSLENCFKYNILIDYFDVKDTLKDIVNSRVGQFSQIFKANEEIINFGSGLLYEKYLPLIRPTYVMKDIWLDRVRIEFNSPPYLIEVANNNISPKKAGTKPVGDIVLGYIVRINSQNILVGPEGIYEIAHEGSIKKETDADGKVVYKMEDSKFQTKIVSLYFPVDCEANIDYRVSFTEKKDTSTENDIVFYNNVVGQIRDAIDPQESIFIDISRKYTIEYNSYYSRLVSLDGVRIEAQPGSVFYIQDSTSRQQKRIVLNETGFVVIHDNDSILLNIRARGIHLEPASKLEATRKILPENKFINVGTFETFKDVKEPRINGVYYINKPWRKNLKNNSLTDIPNNIDISVPVVYNEIIQETEEKEWDEHSYIYYEGKWRPFTKKQDVVCPIQALIDYWGTVLKGQRQKKQIEGEGQAKK